MSESQSSSLPPVLPPEEPKPRLKPFKGKRKGGANSKLTVAKVQKALQESGGDLEYARLDLCVTLDELRKFIASEKKLSFWAETRPATWTERNAVMTETGVSTPFQSKITEDQLQEVQRRETEAFKEDLTRAGVADADGLIAIRDLARNNFASTFELMHGGLTQMFANVREEREEVRELHKAALKRLRETEDPASRALVFREALMLGEMLRKIGDEMIRTTESTQRGALTLAAMRQSQRAKKKKFKWEAATSGPPRDSLTLESK
jgi:hypothetical protein